MKKLLLSICISMFALAGHCSDTLSQPVRIITSLPVGSGPDVLLRKVSDQLSKKWRTPVIVDNRPGGAGGIGLTAYNQSTPDGYTIYYSDSSVVVSYPILYKNPKIVEDIRPLVPVTRNYMMLFASQNVEDFRDLKSKIIKKPTFGSWGVGSAGHLAGVELFDFINASYTHVPYKDYNQWFIDVSSQDVSYGYSTIASSVKMVQSSKIKYIAYLGSSRHPNYPNVPTMLELTGHKFQYTTAWLAFYVHKTAPDSITSKLEKDIREVLKSPEIQDAMLAMHYQPWNAGLNEFNTSVSTEIETYIRLAKKHNININ